jgi:hypothetical protein
MKRFFAFRETWSTGFLLRNSRKVPWLLHNTHRNLQLRTFSPMRVYNPDPKWCQENAVRRKEQPRSVLSMFGRKACRFYGTLSTLFSNLQTSTNTSWFEYILGDGKRFAAGLLLWQGNMAMEKGEFPHAVKEYSHVLTSVSIRDSIRNYSYINNNCI